MMKSVICILVSQLFCFVQNLFNLLMSPSISSSHSRSSSHSGTLNHFISDVADRNRKRSRSRSISNKYKEKKDSM